MKKILYNTVIMAAGLLVLGVSSCEDEAKIPDTPDIHAVTINQSSLELAMEDMRTITPKFNSVATFQKGFAWTNSDPSVVDIAVNEADYSCEITALTLGEATLTLASLDGTLAANCRIVVNKATIPVLEHPVYINFWTPFSPDVINKPWNALGASDGRGHIEWGSFECNNMYDAEDNQTQTSIAITQNFSWGDKDDANAACPLPAAYAPLTEVPEIVARTHFKNDNNTVTGMLKLTGLRAKQQFHLNFFTSRMGWGDVCATKVTVKGREEHTLTILTKKTSSNVGVTGEAIPAGTSTGMEPSEANTTVRVGRTPEMYPDSDGSIVISITAGKGGNQPSGAHFISAMWIDPVEDE